MSSDVSEESTLLPSSPPEDTRQADDDPNNGETYYKTDTPVRLNEFKWNVGVCKVLLAPGLLASVGLEVIHIWGLFYAFDIPLRDDDGFWESKTRIWAIWADAFAVLASSLCLLLYLLTLFWPIVYPRSPRHEPLRNLAIHRNFCQWTFILFTFLPALQFAPSIGYITITHQATFELIPSIPHLDLYRSLAFAYTLLVVGSTRRGPRLRYDPLNLGTGFGINADDKIAPAGGKMVIGRGVSQIGTEDDDDSAEEDEGGTIIRVKVTELAQNDVPNVTDYAGSPMFLFILIAYMAPLARRSLKVTQLDLSDLPHMEDWVRNDPTDRNLPSPTSSKEGAIRLEDESQGPKVTRWMLVKTLYRGRIIAILITLAVETAVTCFGFLQIVSLHEIIRSRDDPTQHDKSYAKLMCWFLFLSHSVASILSAYSWSRENYNLHMPIRMSLASLLFTKILKTTDVKAADAHNVSKEDNEAGKGRAQIINLLTIDTHNISGLAVHIWHITNAIITLLLGTYMLYAMLGVSAFIGIACVPLSAPLSIWVARKSYLADIGWARSRDARTSAIKEFLLCYKVIKLNAFEPYFKLRIENLRAIEVVWQRWRYTLGTLFNILAGQLANVAIIITFIFYTKVFGNRLEPATAFVAFSVFDRVKDGLQAVPSTAQEMFQSLIAINRITEFLNRPEVELSDWVKLDNSISLTDATVSWPEASGEVDEQLFKLRNMNFAVPEGKITLVCGPLGSGKTLLLRALLGEAHVDRGIVRAPRSTPEETPINGYAVQRPWTNASWLDDSVSYAPQQAYIRHGSIRDNILFGQPMWRSRYKEVLRQASLLPDIALMDDGDLTEVGDNGINLSGGQKARINLARCLYSRSKTVYLDDILSAVDAHTAQFIVNDCLQGELVKGRTVVLVTHHVNLCLPAVNYVISLKEGNVEQACPAKEAKIDEIDGITSPTKSHSNLPNVPMEARLPEVRPKGDERKDGQTPMPRQHYREEQKSLGRVATSHYLLVLKAAGGLFYWTIFVLLYGGACAFIPLVPLALRYWTEHPAAKDLNRNLLIYLGVNAVPMFLHSFKWVWLYGWGYRGFYNRGSKVIHATLLNRIMEAPLAFFERTPAGRLMNIFGQDTFRLDSQSADDVGRILTAASGLVASVLVVCWQVPALLSIILVIGLPLYWLSGVLGKLRADLRRLTAVAGSPLITLYHDTIEGIVMIRAFGTGQVMQAALHTLLNRERTAWSADWQVFNFVRGTVQAISSIFVTITGFVLVNTELSGAQVGFILGFAVSASSRTFNCLECYSNLELTFVSAERVNQYIQMEDHESKEGLTPPEDWPDKGSISFNSLSVRYADDLPEVLHDVTFKVEPGMRVGLVGSTGSGKSTLALSLFRALDPHRGNIEIDGLDIKDVELSQLRRRLNMVVQDGTLCSGSLRDALDITGAKDDYEIYEALKRVHLLSNDASQEELENNPFANLDSFVAVEGANFSHGQRQLLCLARALLKNSKILVMDEATSSVDFEMDARITNTIKECFTDTTMIVIAHRLATIMQYDRVLVLDKGAVKEYGSPLALIRDEGSAFHSLCMAQGEEEYEKLFAMATA